MENYHIWINLILAIEGIGIVIVAMQYIPTLKNKIPIRIGIILIGGGLIVKLGFYVNHFLFN